MYRKDINRDIQILTYTSLWLEGQKEIKMMKSEEVSRRIKDLLERDLLRKVKETEGLNDIKIGCLRASILIHLDFLSI